MLSKPWTHNCKCDIYTVINKTFLTKQQVHFFPFLYLSINVKAIVKLWNQNYSKIKDIMIMPCILLCNEFYPGILHSYFLGTTAWSFTSEIIKIDFVANQVSETYFYKTYLLTQLSTQNRNRTFTWLAWASNNVSIFLVADKRWIRAS